jgi:hypothetical protein
MGLQADFEQEDRGVREAGGLGFSPIFPAFLINPGFVPFGGSSAALSLFAAKICFCRFAHFPGNSLEGRAPARPVY